MLAALGRRGVQVPFDPSLAAAYRALHQCHELYPSVFGPAVEILMAEIEGGATGIADVPKRLGHLAELLDRLHRAEELDAWAEEDLIVVA